MKVWLLSLLLASSAGELSAQPVDLLQQLYGKKSSAAPSPAKEEENEDLKPVPTETLTLTFRDRYEASRERLYLSDLIGCKGSKTLCDEIKAIDIGRAPKPLRQERYSRKQVADFIEKEFPSQALMWEGSEFCQVIALSAPVQEEAVMKVLQEEFEDAPAGLRVVIQSIRVPSLQMLRHNNYSYKILAFGDQVARVFQNPRTRFAQLKVVAVDQDPSSQSSIEFLVQVSLRIELDAPVLKTSKERGERLSEADFESEWINYQDQILLDPKQIIGKLLKTRVSAGNPIRNWDVTREPEVLRGDRVEAIVSGNGLKINGIAQALEQGFIGQKIRIRLDATKKTVMGTVIARSQVEVPTL